MEKWDFLAILLMLILFISLAFVDNFSNFTGGQILQENVASRASSASNQFQAPQVAESGQPQIPGGEGETAIYTRTPSKPIRPQTSQIDEFDGFLPSEESREVRELTSKLLELNKGLPRISRFQFFQKKSSLKEMEQVAEERKEKLKVLAGADANLFLENTLTDEERKQLPKSLRYLVEEKISLEGNITSSHIHRRDLEKEEVINIYFVISDGELYEFYSPSDLGFLPLSKIKIEGYKLDEVIVGYPQEITPIEERVEQEEFPSSKAMGEKKGPKNYKMAVVMVDFLDSSPSSIDAQQMRNIIFDSQFQKFYNEQSYGKINFSGDVFGWVTLQKNYSEQDIVQDLPSIILNQSINPEDYDILVSIINRVGYNGGAAGFIPFITDNGTIFRRNIIIFGDEGSSILNFLHPSIWSAYMSSQFNWTNLDFVLSHEEGHALGLAHANGLDCGNLSYAYGTGCTLKEYGNPFDVMGGNGNGFSLHFNAFYKEKLNWVSPAEILNITASGNYTIGALEDSNALKKIAKVCIFVPSQNPPICPFYIEYRKALGFDKSLAHPDISSNQGGLLINQRNSKSLYTNSHIISFLLDADPTLSDWNSDVFSASLSSGSSVYDPSTGITIGPVWNSNASGITFEVKIEEVNCTRQVPILDVFPSSISLYPGSNFDYAKANIKNLDFPVCGPSTFELDTTFPQGIFGYLSNTLSIYPELSGGYFSSVYIHPSTPPGSYALNVNATNLDSGLSTTKSIPINVLNPKYPIE